MQSARIAGLLAGLVLLAVPASGSGDEYFSIAPCRLVDTRGPAGPSGGPALAHDAPRDFAAAGGCAIPDAASAITVNVTAVEATGLGSLALYPAGMSAPDTSNLSFPATIARAAATVIGLNADGDLAVKANLAVGSGSVHVILDVSGYFVPVVRFAAIGDTGQANQGQLDVALALDSKCEAEGCDFVVLLGDNIYPGGVVSTSDTQWADKFETPYQDIDVDFWAVLGNHDYGGNGSGTEFDKGQHQVDYTQVSDKWQMPDNFYRQAFEHVELFALDTNLQLYGDVEEQEGAVPGWLSGSTARWKIAFGHHPYKSNGPHGNAGNYDGQPSFILGAGQGVKDFFDDHICGEVDIYLSGHDHSLQWLTDSTCAELLVSGGGASTTTLSTNNAAHFQQASLGFLYVEIVGDSFTGQFIDTDGTVLFERTLVKP